MKTKSLTKLTDNELVRRLERLCGTEREILVTVLRYLIEVESRELYLLRGYSSLHEFCTGHLKYSSTAAGRRIGAARCVKRYPHVASMLLRGEINLSVLSLVTGMLTEGNYRDILSRMKGRSYREVERLVARYRPTRGVRDRVRPVYIKTELRITSEGGENSTPDVGSSASLKSTAYGDNFAFGVGSAQSCVVLEEKFKLEFAVDPLFMKKIERLRAILSTKHPKKLDFEQLFDILMDDYLDRHSPEGRIRRKERRAEARERMVEARERGEKAKERSERSRGTTEKIRQEDKPRRRSRTQNKSITKPKQSRYIPQSVRDEVYTKDGGRCTYVGTNGKRCIKRENLEVDHIVPFAKGGKNTKANLRLLCPRHNMLLAEEAYGKEHMNQFRQKE